MCIRDRYKAIKVLPDYSIVHKQDFFIKENYQPDTERDAVSYTHLASRHNPACHSRNGEVAHDADNHKDYIHGAAPVRNEIRV